MSGAAWSVVERTPEKPGPGPLPDQLLRALDLTVVRRVEGLLSGDHRAHVLGRGTELAQVRPYVPGEDDVRDIDWNVTARTGEPHVRVQLAERVLVSWIVLDTSVSMTFGTADRRKADVAEGVALALGHVATRHGNRLGVLTFGDEEPDTLPPRQGRTALVGLLLALQGIQDETAARRDLAGAALQRAGAIARQQAFVAVISDFRGPRDWRRPCSRWRVATTWSPSRSATPARRPSPTSGTLRLVDPETGRQLRVDTSSERLRARYAEAAAAERLELARTFAALGVGHVVLSTSGDGLRMLAGFLRTRSRRR